MANQFLVYKSNPCAYCYNNKICSHAFKYGFIADNGVEVSFIDNHKHCIRDKSRPYFVKIKYNK